MLTLKADKSPAETLALTNRVTLNPTDHAQLGKAKHVTVRLPNGQQLVFTVEATGSNPAGCIGFNTPHRRWGAIEVTKSVSWNLVISSLFTSPKSERSERRKIQFFSLLQKSETLFTFAFSPMILTNFKTTEFFVITKKS